MNHEIKPDPLFQKYLLPEYVHEANLAGKPFSIAFHHTDIADFTINDALYIHGERFEIPELVNKSITIFIGYAVSDAFAAFNNNGSLVGTVCILLEGQLLKSYKQIGSIRVDNGRLQLANGDFSKHIEALLEKNKIAETEELFDLLKSGDIPDASLSNIEETYFSYGGVLDSINFIDIDSGYGDGTYPVYLAFNKNEKPCALYIDFLLFDRPDIIEKMIR